MKKKLCVNTECEFYVDGKYCDHPDPNIMDYCEHGKFIYKSLPKCDKNPCDNMDMKKCKNCIAPMWCLCPRSKVQEMVFDLWETADKKLRGKYKDVLPPSDEFAKQKQP